MLLYGIQNFLLIVAIILAKDNGKGLLLGGEQIAYTYARQTPLFHKKGQNLRVAYLMVFYVFNFLPGHGKNTNGSLNACGGNFNFIRCYANKQSGHAHAAEEQFEQKEPAANGK